VNFDYANSLRWGSADTAERADRQIRHCRGDWNCPLLESIHMACLWYVEFLQQRLDVSWLNLKMSSKLHKSCSGDNQNFSR